MNWKTFLKRNGNWIGFFLLVIIVTILTDGSFLSPRNLTNLLRQTSVNGILAAGMTMIILTGGIDLSIGSVVALCGIFVGMSQVNWGWGDMGTQGAIMSLSLGVGVGLLVGSITGGLVSFLGIAPFVISLGMMVICRGLALILSEGSGISPIGDSLRTLGEAYFPHFWTIIVLIFVSVVFVYQHRRNKAEAIFPLLTFVGIGWAFMTYKGFPVPVFFLMGAMGLASLLLMQTTLGRCIYAVGSNEQAAFWAGVPVRKVKWFVYAAMGLLSGLAGVLLTARLNAAIPTAGELFELDAIAAAVIGGTSLKGGHGSIIGSFVGALTIATLNNGMDLLGVPSFYQMVLKGLIIIIAVGLDKGNRRA